MSRGYHNNTKSSCTEGCRYVNHTRLDTHYFEVHPYVLLYPHALLVILSLSQSSEFIMDSSMNSWVEKPDCYAAIKTSIKIRRQPSPRTVTPSLNSVNGSSIYWLLRMEPTDQCTAGHCWGIQACKLYRLCSRTSTPKTCMWATLPHTPPTTLPWLIFCTFFCLFVCF